MVVAMTPVDRVRIVFAYTIVGLVIVGFFGVLLGMLDSVPGIVVVLALPLAGYLFAPRLTNGRNGGERNGSVDK